jgi:hypothetical protein
MVAQSVDVNRMMPRVSVGEAANKGAFNALMLDAART